MRVAALHDVHGNLPALEAVLGDVEREHVDAIVFGGDIASGVMPRETVELVRSLDAVFIRGNADRVDSPAMSPEHDLARRWVETQLDDEQISWLANLDFSVVLDDTLYVHATPQDDLTVITEVTSDERLAELLDGVEQSRVVAGHTHMQLDRTIGSIRFVNAGSVGMPYEGKPGAYWAILDDDVELRRTEYDLERAAAAFRATSHPLAEHLAADNILVVPSREEAIAMFGG
ncbi:MAG TPA: metallophosphoesterase family protein [Gaiellaceae bacterium]|nr:metallophosphoesterase family protein [Gaiellaceae bacterium]